MSQYRTRAKIISDILTTVRDSNVSGGAVGITMLLRRGNVSYSRMMRLITDFVGVGLLEKLELEKSSRYKISEKGLRFLKVYHQFEEFESSFGLHM